MALETFDDLKHLDNQQPVKAATLQALYDLYYGQGAPSPTNLDDFTTELRTRLGGGGVSGEDIGAVVTILSTEIANSHGSSPASFATAFLSDAGWLNAEDAFSDVTDWFHEKYLDEATGYYYDTEGNWYNANHELITAPPAAEAAPSNAASELEAILQDPQVKAATAELAQQVEAAWRKLVAENREAFTQITASQVEQLVNEALADSAGK